MSDTRRHAGRGGGDGQDVRGDLGCTMKDPELVLMAKAHSLQESG